jgi:probable rRNA maturation factor
MSEPQRLLARVNLEVAVEVGVPQLDEQFAAWADAAIRCSDNEPEQSFGINVRILGEVESSELNERFRSISKPTNVLAFPVGNRAILPASQVAELGDLAICMPVVQREALEQGKDVCAHLAHMMVHGTLHLIGYDHEGDADAEHMEACEQQAMAVLGFQDPYIELS